METQAISLNVHPQIIDLYEVLEKNGLHKQKEDVQSLVGYIESMEYNLSVMMNEIQEMHAEVNLLHDKGIRAKCAKIVTKAEDKILQVGTMVSVAKGKVVESAGAAVKAFKEKGKSALVQAVEGMQIPAALSKIKSGFSGKNAKKPLLSSICFYIIHKYPYNTHLSISLVITAPPADIHCQKAKSRAAASAGSPAFLVSDGRFGRKFLLCLRYLAVFRLFGLIPSSVLHLAENLFLDPVLLLQNSGQAVAHCRCFGLAQKGVVHVRHLLLRGKQVGNFCLIVKSAVLFHIFLRILFQIGNQLVKVPLVHECYLFVAVLQLGVGRLARILTVLFDQVFLHGQQIGKPAQLFGCDLCHFFSPFPFQDTPIMKKMSPDYTVHTAKNQKVSFRI